MERQDASRQARSSSNALDRLAPETVGEILNCLVSVDPLETMKSLNALRRTSKQLYNAVENDEKTGSLYRNLSRLGKAIDVIYRTAIPEAGFDHPSDNAQSHKAYAHTRIEAVEATLHFQPSHRKRELVTHVMDMEHGLDQAWAIGRLAHNLKTFNRTESNAILQKSFEYFSDDLQGMSHMHIAAGGIALVEADIQMTPLQRQMVQTILEATGQRWALNAATSICQRRAELRRERLTKWEERIAATASGSRSSSLDHIITEIEKSIQERVTQSQSSDFVRMTNAIEIQVHLADLVKRTIDTHQSRDLGRERTRRSEFGR
ncbi:MULTISPECIES: hypothetical protein [unclassified Rhizobium]|uniref:hypothetical protein n=1 Tax=unclassified Rhizobium TaxID=2613769 RepID=UPI001ADCBD77|nr:MULTISPECIES: hypothetical protein [unclassified Rhizobium]MBO9126440.1 hypothetical protein [Rhizobium sp. 16-488-2b]MBO9178375.1 hypothetical protein [Rhizobium sp. 16-488-2a]MBO9194920.1 hypothetical protein [Rhizobium sp. 16-449-1b]